ncbi:uncharacterized protein LOC126885259 [Diabrotica virgifera virgifera]|uniref:Uncharacterized protein n=1 Tax=Diabrotica virgifera virgifera TaxID=50390 RepID=A0ABM5KC08_DIAVI|nr:uncharacterized protein LOC126885259 [Diabrotica virgifera virgifera]XP_050507703.1 uncharacterized protein LOC126885259 [Diabrotica virgifera virgifera]XP_050507710.1 uncharacterized protein LOC126885259 [Diabrotica virgifera virgifera]XP_050507715.1 uncharacterized protein LOC126885259 [Diabrotica virgifera virgifera]XP_050507721.1 uncharacterized protein LOC126885259 [Diabrotica virgifera virgifera]
MSLLRAFKEAAKRREALNKKLKETGKVYKVPVPVGWKSALGGTEDDRRLGLHHIYQGIHVDKNDCPDYLAARDIVLSVFISRGFTELEPEQQAARVLVELFCDTLYCRARGLAWNDASIPRSIQMGFVSLAKHSKLKSLTEDEWAKIIDDVPAVPAVTPKSLVDAFKSLGALDKDTVNIHNPSPESKQGSWVHICVYGASCYLMKHAFFKLEFEYALLILFSAVSKTGRPKEQFIKKKNRFFFGLGYIPIFLEEMTSITVQTLWAHIKRMLDSNTLTTVLLMKSLKELSESTTNQAVFPLFTQITYRNLSYIEKITEAMSNHRSFPWGYLIKKQPILSWEYERFISILPLVKQNPYRVLQLSGFGQKLKILTFISTQLLIKHGNSTLQKYKGVGPLDVRVIIGPYLLKFIDAYKRDTQKSKLYGNEFDVFERISHFIKRATEEEVDDQARTGRSSSLSLTTGAGTERSVVKRRRDPSPKESHSKRRQLRPATR